MQLALFQPDQPQNTGTLLRLGACMRAPVHVIEPCGFPFSTKALKRYAMDYADHVDIRHHLEWSAFLADQNASKRRIILLTTKTDTPYTRFSFSPNDTLLVGSESAGAPDFVHQKADAQITIPMAPEVRSLNVAVAMAMVLGEALRQTNLMPVTPTTASC
jgi:tRNA (cytidine/uridine-2'-O-)-methyltransferase